MPLPSIIVETVNSMPVYSYVCLVPHQDPPAPLSNEACSFLNCEFEEDQIECLERLSGSGWRRSSQPTGNAHTGIRYLKTGAFIFSKGRGNESEMPIDDEGDRREVIEERGTKQQDEQLHKSIKSGGTSNVQQTSKESRLHLSNFELPRQLILEFCIYMATEGSRLILENHLRGYCRSRQVNSPQPS